MNKATTIEFHPAPLNENSDLQVPSEIERRFSDKRSILVEVVLPALLLLAYVAQCAWFIESQSFTFDEPINILSGLEQWRTGQFSGGRGMNDHPPLARQLCTLPAIDSRFEIGDKTIPNPDSVAWHNSDFSSFGRILPTPETMAWHTRPVNAMLGAILGLLLWLAARALYSIHAANFVLTLFAFSPSLVAHFSLAATNDGALALMLFAAVFQLWRWYQNQSWVQTIVLGLALGGLLITKGSAIPFFIMAIGLILVLKPGLAEIRPTEWNWRKTITVLVICFFVVWGAYRFHVSKVTLTTSDIKMRIVIPQRPDSIVGHISRTVGITVPIPAFEFVQGIVYQLRHNERGHPGYLLGRIYEGGSKWYFPLVIGLKWPTIVLLLLITALVAMFVHRDSRPRNLALWFSFPVLYLALAEFSHLNLGERYVLPIYPFALLLCGSLWQLIRGRRLVLILLLFALAIHVADVLSYAPDYLSYFNVLVKRTDSYKVLSDSNVDWGQGLIALRRYQQGHPTVPIYLAYFGNVAPSVYGIKAIPLMPGERVSGTVIISANYLSGQTLPDPSSYHWLLQYPTKLILNHSLYVFEVPDQIK